MRTKGGVEKTEVVVIGAGQCGLSVGYHLKKANIPFTILDAHERIGDAWRKRWDSLRLFTPARYDGLVGMRFPSSPTYFPTKDEMADFLEAYAAKFDLPVETGVTVDRVSKRGGNFIVSAGNREIEARQVVVAMANYQRPVVPAFAHELKSETVQLHSRDYKNPSQLREGEVLVVGAANSGAEIAMDLARGGRKVILSGHAPAAVPFRIDSFFGLHVMQPILLGFVFHHLLTLDTPLGRKAKPAGRPTTTPLLRVKPQTLDAAGVKRVGRVARIERGVPVLENGEAISAPNVMWCTGFTPGFSSWIDLPVFDEHGGPVHRRGVVEGEPGLYFIGLHFLYAMSSPMIQGAARDSTHIAVAIARLAGMNKRVPLVGTTRAAVMNREGYEAAG